MTERNRMRLRVFDDPVNVERLVNLPESMMRSVARLPDPGYNDAVRAQTALAIAIELVAPLRAKNLAGLRLDRHLIRSRPGPGAVMHLVVPAGEVKNKNPLEFELPPDVVRLARALLGKIPTPSRDRWLQLPFSSATGRSQDARAIGRTNQARHKDRHGLDGERPSFPACLRLPVPQSPSGRVRDCALAPGPHDPSRYGASLLRVGAVRRGTALRQSHRHLSTAPMGRTACPLRSAVCQLRAWPERDRLAWEAGTRRADLFEQKSAGADWSPRSRSKDRTRLWPLALLAEAERSVLTRHLRLAHGSPDRSSPTMSQRSPRAALHTRSFAACRSSTTHCAS